MMLRRRCEIQGKKEPYPPAATLIVSTLGMHRLPAEHRAHHRDVLDLVRLDLVRVLAQYHEVGQLAFRDRTLGLLLERGIGAVDGAGAQGFLDADLLLFAPDAAAVVLARDHALDGHQWL